jgi:hypothetical protein
MSCGDSILRKLGPFSRPIRSGYGQETGKFSPTNTGIFSPTATDAAITNTNRPTCWVGRVRIGVAGLFRGNYLAAEKSGIIDLMQRSLYLLPL